MKLYTPFISYFKITVFVEVFSIITELSMMVIMITELQIVDAQSNGAYNITSMCLGYAHSCVVFNQRTVKCAGNQQNIGTGSSGTIGSTVNELGDNLPFIDFGIGDQLITKVTCGSAHSCVLFDSEKVKCFGSNSAGQIGIGVTISIVGNSTGYVGDTLPFINIGNGLKIKGLASGRFHNCVLVPGNKVKCFGNNDSGQLGYGNTARIGTDSSKLGDFLPFLDFGTNVEVDTIYLESAAFHTCIGLLKPTEYAQRIKCWGLGSFFRLGYGNNTNIGDKPGQMGDNLPLVDLGSESRVMQMSLGVAHVCAMLIDRVVKCWGSGLSGKLGLGWSYDTFLTGNSLPPVPIDQGRSIKYFKAGGSHSCFGYEDNLTLKCVGRNNFGQLGQGDTEPRGDQPNTTIPYFSPVDLGTGALTITALYSTNDYNCVLFSDSSVRCFGKNDSGQFANGGEQSIGVTKSQMGKNLKASIYFGAITHIPTTGSIKPTQSPTKQNNPTTLSPTKSPISLQPWEISLIVVIPVIAIILLFACWIRNRVRKVKIYRDLSPTEENKSNFVYFTFAGDAKNHDKVAEQIQKNNSERSKSEDARKVIVGPTLKDADDIERCIRESENFILVLNNEYFVNARNLVEIFMAIKLVLHIFFIFPSGSDFHLNKVKEMLSDLHDGDHRLAKLSSEIEKQGCDPKEVGKVLAIELPNVMTLRCIVSNVVHENEGNIDSLISYIECTGSIKKNPKAVCNKSSEVLSPNGYCHHCTQHGLELKLLIDVIGNIREEKSKESEKIKESIVSPEGWEISID